MTRRPKGQTAGDSSLLAQAKTTDDFEVPRAGRFLEILEEAVPLAHQHEEPAPAGVVLLVHLEMLGQILDASRQDGNLHFGAAGIRRSAAIPFDNARFVFFGNCHRVPLPVFRSVLSTPPNLCYIQLLTGVESTDGPVNFKADDVRGERTGG